MTVDTKALREAAEKATPGIRKHIHDQGFGEVRTDEMSIYLVNRVEDGDFAVQANPQTILQLLDRLERLEWIEKQWEQLKADNNLTCAELRATDKALEKLDAKNKQLLDVVEAARQFDKLCQQAESGKVDALVVKSARMELRKAIANWAV